MVTCACLHVSVVVVGDGDGSLCPDFGCDEPDVSVDIDRTREVCEGHGDRTQGGVCDFKCFVGGNDECGGAGVYDGTDSDDLGDCAGWPDVDGGAGNVVTCACVHVSVEA